MLYENGDSQNPKDTLKAYVWYRLCAPYMQYAHKDYVDKQTRKLEESMSSNDLKKAEEEIRAFRPKVEEMPVEVTTK